MTTVPPQSQGKLTREEIDKYLLGEEILDADGKQIRPIPREIVESLIEMNGGPQGIDLSNLDFSEQFFERIDLTDAILQGANLVSTRLDGAYIEGADFSGAQLLYDQLSDEQRSAIRGEPYYLDREQQFDEFAQKSGVDEETEVSSSVPAEVLPGQTFATNDEFDGVDRLDMNKYARALARLVMMEESTPPLTIGIYGEWGSGKSALLRLIRKELENEQESRNLPLLVVDFNAWEHAGDHDKLWAALTQSIVAAMDKKTSLRKRFYYGLTNNIRFLWERTKERWPVALLGGTGLAAMICGQAWGWSTGSPSNMAWAVTGLGAIFGSPSFFEALKTGLSPMLTRPASSRLTMIMKDAMDASEPQSVADLIGQMLSRLETAIPQEFERNNRAIGAWPGVNPTENKGLKTVVFIDDLDRCPPDKIVDVLEGIKLILKDRSFIVFLSADTRIVSRAIEYRYRQILQSGNRKPAGELGMEYLAKIVQIPFLLPKPGKTELQSLIAGRQQRSAPSLGITGSPSVTLTADGNPANGSRIIEPASIQLELGTPEEEQPRGDSVSNWETVSISEEECQTLVDLAHQFTQNPRTYNRLGNELRLMRLLLYEKGIADHWTMDKRGQMIKWLILCDLWPAFGQYLRIEQIIGRGDEFVDSNRIMEIAKSPESMRLLKTRYDDQAIEDLHAFLNQAPPLSIQTVRELVPFTTNLTGIYE